MDQYQKKNYEMNVILFGKTNDICMSKRLNVSRERIKSSILNEFGVLGRQNESLDGTQQLRIRKD